MGFEQIPHQQNFSPLPKEWIEQNVFTVFKNIALQHPDKTAISDGHLFLTYQELLKKIESIAFFIQQKSGENKAPIGIWMDNNPDFIATMLACTACGIPYVPLDNSFPEERNKEIIEHAKVQFIIDSSFLRQYVILTKEGTIALDNQSNSLAYILYTSGSSGKPKGVFQNQRNLLHDVWQYINAIQLHVNDRCSLFYSPSVNGAIRDIYGTLLSGATLFMKDLKKEGLFNISSFLKENKITVLHAIPTVFRSFLSISKNEFYDSVRLVYLAGDRIFRSDFELYKNYFSENAFLYIGIGSTENATIYRQWFLNHQTKIDSDLVPVGYTVEDRQMELVPGSNEIQVTSKYMALGYWNDAELTQQYFRFNEDGSRTFKTGDIGEINTEELLEFKGRKDRQIKINGHRVEVDEVLAKIKSLSQVSNAAIVIRNENIIAYIERKNEIKKEEIIKTLSHKLPMFMMPSLIYFLDKIPLLANFKIDIQQLNKIDLEHSKNEKESDVKSKTISQQFETIWREYTSIESFSNDFSFRSGGGSSIDAVNFLIDIERTFSISFPFEIIHQDMTPSFILQNVKRLVNESLIEDNAQKNSPIVYVFHWICGLPEGHKKIISALSKYCDVKILSYPDYSSWKNEQVNFQYFCDELEKNMPDETRPAIFLGLLSGTYFAQEMASRYKGEVHSCILLDFVAPDNKSNIKKIFSRGKNIVKKLAGKITKEEKDQSKLINTAKLSVLTCPAHIVVLNNSNAKSGNEYLGWDNYFTNTTAHKYAFSHVALIKNEKLRNELENDLHQYLSSFINTNTTPK